MDPASTTEWSEEKCLQLIREYRGRPMLWDPKDPFFFKKSMKPVAWQEIAEAIDVPAEKCKHKMVILMSSFRREKAKIVHSLREESDESRIYNSTWFAFKDMAFLMDKDTERKRQSELIDDEDEPENMTMKILKHHLDASVIPPPKRLKPVISVKKDFATLSTHTIQEEVFQPRTLSVPVSIPGPSQSKSERHEEIASFTTFIGNKMKKYSDNAKNAVQQAICEIIFKADQNFYESGSCYQKLTIIDEAEVDDSDPLDKALYEAQNGMIKVQSYSDNSD